MKLNPCVLFQPGITNGAEGAIKIGNLYVHKKKTVIKDGKKI